MYAFRIVDAASGQYRVRFTYNSEIMVWSENCTTKDAAKRNISSLKSNAPGAPIVDLTVGEAASGYRWEVVKSSDGQYFTRFVASNGETMVRSERYTQKHNAKNCASSVSNNAGSARVIDETKAQAA